MRRGTPEYNEYMAALLTKADADLANAYRTYQIQELNHDWRCNISERSRDILATEYRRRGIKPPATPDRQKEREAL